MSAIDGESCAHICEPADAKPVAEPYDIVVVPVSTLDKRPDAPEPQVEDTEGQPDG